MPTVLSNGLEVDLSSLAPHVRTRAGFLGLILLLHATIWVLAIILWPALAPARQVAAEVISTFALVLLSVNLILITRARFLERLLHGLDKLFATHRAIGLAIGLLVIAHAIIVPRPEEFAVTRLLGPATLLFLLGAIFVASAPRFPWRRLVPIKYHLWKFGHRFIGFFVAMAVAHSMVAVTYTRQVPYLAAYVYGIAALGLAAWLYRELLFWATGPFTTYEVDRARLLGDDVTEVILKSSDASQLRSPGQFAFVSFEKGPSREQHPFTISSGSEKSVRFSMKASGDFTNKLLSGVPEGSKARIEGPYGAFTFSRGRLHQLWLAGGIGITPFLSMAEDLDEKTRVLLAWSVRDMRDAVYHDELSLIARDKSNLRVIVHPTSELGHLHVAKLQLETEPADYSAFLCGPLPMRRAFERQLLELGVPRSEIYFEEFRLR